MIHAIPLPPELVVPLTIALLAAASFLLKDVNKGKPIKDQIFNILKGVFGVLLILWVVLNVLLNLTGVAWKRLISNEFVDAFLKSLSIDQTKFEDWFVILVAAGLVFLAIKMAAGTKSDSVFGKIKDVLVAYLILILIMGIVMQILFALVNSIFQSYLDNAYLQSLLKFLGLLPAPQ